MASNHEEYSNDNFRKFKMFSTDLRGCTYLYRKSNEGTCFAFFLIITNLSCHSCFAEQHSCIESFSYECYHELSFLLWLLLTLAQKQE